ncbi:hypothetical protein [Capnocytophaga canimorsus]|uniref:hypothetical protein n=1 Tax=Capnocytophaga canimorsus TaxID=28188 RepID=UPI0018E33F49|nr:hypothetical protein [Capnocytophaga canimorsus]
MRKLSGKNAKSLAKAMIYALLPYKDYVKTITSDNGLEIGSIREYLLKKTKKQKKQTIF